ncbi:alpha-L-fucosidase [bacterium]|nr:alpha-L-fucosidase [bacterium]
MKKRLMITVLMTLLVAMSAFVRAAQSETPDQKDARMQWWREARFGMFIHWGIYSVPAGIYHGEKIVGIGEWIMNNARIPVEEYAGYAKQFNPVKFDADAWVQLAGRAGMKYIVITSKHHDGFAMFGTKASPYNIMDATPFRRDPLKELAAACKKHGIRLGFYYSQAQDWHHPGGSAMGGHWDPAQDGSMDAYIEKVAIPQVKEILSNYGKISVLWWDTPFGMTHEQTARFVPLLDLQPGIITNNRLGSGFEGDTETPEQFIPATGYGDRDWETCMTMNDTWGYKSTDHNWKSIRTLIFNLCDIASKGGNYLLNVGPTAEGLIPEASVERLEAIGRWMAVNGEAVYGTQAGPFNVSPWGKCTQQPAGESENGITRLYLHVFNWPEDGPLTISGLSNRPAGAFLLSDPERSALSIARNGDAVEIGVPAQAPDSICSVVVLDIEGMARVTDPPVFSNTVTIFTDSIDVLAKSDYPELELRMSTDGRVPDADAPPVQGPVTVRETSTVMARLFKDGRPVSGTARIQFTRVTPAPGVSPADPVQGIRCRYYEGDWDVIPDFTAMQASKDGISANFGLSAREKDDSYGFHYQGFIQIPEDGIYTFFTESDDGSRLWIGDKPVVDNDGLHAMVEKSGSVALAAGYHAIAVSFFEKGGDDDLKVSWQGPGIEKGPVPDSVLFTEK